ncbi:MAG: hemolysin III family protein [Eubacteriales bacterium]|nr:hemolysin III family protein [Eubacteriales bacterium]
MTRTPLKERKMPDYTRGEEIMNMVTHIVGGSAGVIILIASVVVSSLGGNPWAIVSSAIYGFSMVALYTVSSVYHGLHLNMGKRVMQVIDHCTIYMLIAGTYTPILLVGIRPVHPVTAWIIFGAEWGLAALAATLTAIDLKKYVKFSMACYIIMGWMVVLNIKPVVEAMTWSGFAWLLAGGVSYTIGAVLYGIGRKKKYFHSVFHIFVNIGSLLQAVSIIFYIL